MSSPAPGVADADVDDSQFGGEVEDLLVVSQDVVLVRVGQFVNKCDFPQGTRIRRFTTDSEVVVDRGLPRGAFWWVRLALYGDHVAGNLHSVGRLVQ